MAEQLPEDVIEEVERLTHQARQAVDENARRAYREAREELLAAHDFRARIRDDERDVLVLYPDDWVEDGTVHPERIDDIDRGIELPLEGVLDNDWVTIDAHNTDLAQTVETEHGPVHGANAHALATFMSNHYLKPVEEATHEELSEFLTEYYRRNAWPTDDQKEVVRESVRLVFECAGESVPLHAD